MRPSSSSRSCSWRVLLTRYASRSAVRSIGTAGESHGSDHGNPSSRGGSHADQDPDRHGGAHQRTDGNNATRPETGTDRAIDIRATGTYHDHRSRTHYDPSIALADANDPDSTPT